MNLANYKYMQNDLANAKSPENITAPLTGVSAEVLKFQSFIIECIDRNLKGKAIKQFADEKGFNYSYVWLLNKINDYKKVGIKCLVRKERKDKWEMKAFSDSVLMLMKELYREYQCVATTYKKTHDALMRKSIKFLLGGKKEYSIKSDNDRYVLTLSDGNVHAIQPVKLESGAYITTDGEELLIGDYASAARYFKVIKQNNNDLYYMARQGVQNYRLKKQVTTIKLDYSRMDPNEMWCLDGKQVDIMVMTEDGRHVFRPWLSGIIRAATREYHYELCVTPNSEAIANSITSAVAKWGIPKEMNFDRGKDYRSDLVQSLMSVLGCKKRMSITKLARSKMIESFHNILDNQLKHLPGYTGNNRESMPQATREMIKLYTKSTKEIKDFEKAIIDGAEVHISLNGNPDGRLRKSKKRFLFIGEFMAQLEKALDEYHSRLHGGLDTDELGKRVYDRLCQDELVNEYGERLNTPNGRLEYKIAKGFQPVYTDPAAIAMYAMNYTVRKVQDKVGIQFKNGYFWDARMRTVIGQKVLVRFTNGNTNQLYVFTSDELQKYSEKGDVPKDVITRLKYVCIAKLYDKIHYNDPIYKDKIHEQRTEEKSIFQTMGKSKFYQMNGMENELPKIIKDIEEENSQNNTDDNEYREVELY